MTKQYLRSETEVLAQGLAFPGGHFQSSETALIWGSIAFPLYLTHLRKENQLNLRREDHV
jgi:hypothetical protein